jgi:hypothetical protein
MPPRQPHYPTCRRGTSVSSSLRVLLLAGSNRSALSPVTMALVRAKEVQEGVCGVDVRERRCNQSCARSAQKPGVSRRAR